MKNMIFCVKYKEEREALPKAPTFGRIGELAVNNLSIDGWNLWLKIQAILINEMRISTADTKSVDFIYNEFNRFLVCEDIEREYLSKLRLQISDLPKHLK